MVQRLAGTLLIGDADCVLPLGADQKLSAPKRAAAERDVCVGGRWHRRHLHWSTNTSEKPSWLISSLCEQTHVQPPVKNTVDYQDNQGASAQDRIDREHPYDWADIGFLPPMRYFRRRARADP